VLNPRSCLVQSVQFSCVHPCHKSLRTYLVMIPTLLIALCSLTFDAAIHVAATSIPSSTNRILHGGRLPFSPRGNARPGSFDRDRTRDNRVLEASDSITSYLVDENGNEYEPYSLAWRYLGMYIDCDIEQANGNERRFLEDSGGACERVLLWAAVSQVGVGNVGLASNPITNVCFLLTASHLFSTLTLNIKVDPLVSISSMTGPQAPGTHPLARRDVARKWIVTSPIHISNWWGSLRNPVVWLTGRSNFLSMKDTAFGITARIRLCRTIENIGQQVVYGLPWQTCMGIPCICTSCQKVMGT
jgi:hypothetical protein